MVATAERPPWIGPDGLPMRRLELHLTYHCPQRCFFCSEEHRMKSFNKFPVTWGRVVRTLRLHYGRGIRAVHLTGGEPTIHPRFVDTLILAKRLGMRTSVGTAGTMLSREDFARAALPHLDEAMFSMHGPNAEVHDHHAVYPGSFEMLVQAMTLCRELEPDCGRFVNIVLTRENVDHLEATVAKAEELGAQLIIVSNMTPEGGAGDLYDKIAVRFEELAEKLPAAVRGAKGAVLRFFGVPMCLLGEHALLSNDLHWDPRVTVEWTEQPGKVAFAPIYTWDVGRRRVHPAECETCAAKKICHGVFDDAAARWSLEALKPLSDPPGRAH